MNYTAIIEKAEDGSHSAYVPDLPGCVACGNSLDEVKTQIAEAIILHIDSLRRHGEQTSQPVPSFSDAASDSSATRSPEGHSPPASPSNA